MKRPVDGIRRDMKAMGYDLSGFTDRQVTDGITSAGEVIGAAGVSAQQLATCLNAISVAVSGGKRL